MSDPVAAFAADVGPADRGSVVAVGGRTQWDVGGGVEAPDGSSVREVRPPAGIVAVDAADMTVRARAGTTVADLDAALAEVGQCVALPAWDGATIGGVLAVGRSGLRRLGWGPVRDTVLEIRAVSAEGRVVKAGGPTVKNVSGYDLCRLLVGSLGTLGLLAEVVLRTRPVPAAERWLAGEADPFTLVRTLHRPAAVLWDGTTTWALLDGHPDDVAAEAARTGLTDADGPPELPPHRWSMRPSALPTLARRSGSGWAPGAGDTGGTDGAPGAGDTGGTGGATVAGGSGRAGGTSGAGGSTGSSDGDGPGPFVAEVGVGVVHATRPPPARTVTPEVERLHRRIKDLFDPTGRLAPGRDPLAA